MTDRAEIEKLVRDCYAARIRGDVEGAMRFFDANVQFEIVGDPATMPAAGRSIGAHSFRAQLTNLVHTFTFHSHEILSIVIDGSKAAVRARVKLTSTVTGRTVETELADFIEVKDGRIVSFAQFADTALVATLLTK
jgi:ketosteroid isomerase-like protein